MRIGLKVSENLKTLLEEIFNYELVDIENYKEKIDIAIVDVENEDLEESLIEFRRKGIITIVLVGEKDIRKMRELFLKEMVDDCILRKDIFNLEESISNLKDRIKITSSIYLSDSFKKGFYDLSEINYISYSSISRKTEFHLFNLKIFDIRKNFSEVEDQVSKIEIFYKLDRSTIINLEQIEILDLKEEVIIFKNEDKLYVSKSKLKEIEQKCILLKNRIFIGI